MTTRAEHLKWCKDRANECLDKDNPTEAIACFISDVGKHPETEKIASSPLWAVGMMSANDVNATRKFINDWG